ncbi:MAG: phosphatase PAP2 family protein, partial [Dehalococcoidia bacterium]
MSLASHDAPLPAARPARQRAFVAASEFLLTGALLVVYFSVRGAAGPDQLDASVTRGLSIVRFEQSVGMFQEAWLQSLFIDYDWAMTFANLVYAWGHFPILAAIGIWLAVKDVGRFRFMRNVMLLSGIIGVACYYFIPTAPPRLLESHGFDFGF